METSLEELMEKLEILEQKQSEDRKENRENVEKILEKLENLEQKQKEDREENRKKLEKILELLTELQHSKQNTENVYTNRFRADRNSAINDLFIRICVTVF